MLIMSFPRIATFVNGALKALKSGDLVIRVNNFLSRQLRAVASLLLFSYAEPKNEEPFLR